MRSSVNVAIEPKVYHKEIKINDFCWRKKQKSKKNQHNKKQKQNKIRTTTCDSLLFYELDFFQN